MIKNLIQASAFVLAISCATGCSSSMDMNRLMSAATQGIQAMTITDDQVASYVHQSVLQMDAQNPVAPENDPYTKRLRNLTSGLTSVDGVPLNFKVYKVKDVNAFACADGSVRVFSGIMDLMTDDELLGIIGHEVGHVALHHSRNAIKNELMTGALRDAIGSTSSTMAALSDSQLAQIGQALMSAKYSQKQETAADDFGYDFLRGAKRNPWGMVSSFEKLEKLENGNQSSYITQMFSSHPDTQARIAHITARCKQDGIPRK